MPPTNDERLGGPADRRWAGVGLICVLLAIGVVFGLGAWTRHLRDEQRHHDRDTTELSHALSCRVTGDFCEGDE